MEEKRTKRKKREHDFAVTAFRVYQEAIGEKPLEQSKPRKEYDYKALGHKGGLKGGKARAEKLSPERRKEIAQKAAQTRWGEH